MSPNDRRVRRDLFHGLVGGLLWATGHDRAAANPLPADDREFRVMRDTRKRLIGTWSYGTPVLGRTTQARLVLREDGVFAEYEGPIHQKGLSRTFRNGGYWRVVGQTHLEYTRDMEPLEGPPPSVQLFRIAKLTPTTLVIFQFRPGIFLEYTRIEDLPIEPYVRDEPTQHDAGDQSSASGPTAGAKASGAIRQTSPAGR